MIADPDLIGQIYEAAAIPDLWPIVLARLATLVEADAEIVRGGRGCHQQTDRDDPDTHRT